MILVRRRHRLPMRVASPAVAPVVDDDWSTLLPTQALTAGAAST